MTHAFILYVFFSAGGISLWWLRLPRTDCRRRSLGEGNLDLQIELLIIHVYNRLQQLILVAHFLLGLVSFYLQLS